MADKKTAAVRIFANVMDSLLAGRGEAVPPLLASVDGQLA
jgi:hypothetical protein